VGDNGTLELVTDRPIVLLVDPGFDREAVDAAAHEVFGHHPHQGINLDTIGERSGVMVIQHEVPSIEQRRQALNTARVIWLADKASARPGSRQQMVAFTNMAHSIATPQGRSAKQIASSLAGAAAAPQSAIETVTVKLDGGRQYPVLVGRGATDKLASLIPNGAKRAAIITQQAVGVEVDPGIEHRVFTVADGEEAKQLAVIGELASQCAKWGLTRGDVVVSVGGGAVSDVAGYLAASYHRGVPVIHVSTTLLGQIDAAIGGKCGVNLPEGKNLLGAFKQPVGVICDTNTLLTLPDSEFTSGMGELAKYHFLGGHKLDRLSLDERVAASAAIKAAVVADDETESGRRAILNYGHTLAHALETALDHTIRHGEAVAIGLIYAAEVALSLGRIDKSAVEEHRRVLDVYGLDASLPGGVDHDELVDLFARDKKALKGPTFVLDGPQGLESVVVEDRGLLLDALEKL